MQRLTLLCAQRIKTPMSDAECSSEGFVSDRSRPLVSTAACGGCANATFFVAVVTPGFRVHCHACQSNTESGVIIRCVSCGVNVCQDCILKGARENVVPPAETV